MTGCRHACTPPAGSIFSGQRSTHTFSLRGAAVGVMPLKRRIGGVDSVHTFGFGPGRTGVGSGRIPYVSGGVQCLQGMESGSSPTSGTCFPCSGACEPLSVHKMFTYRPLRGLFCWPVLWLGAPILLASGVACYLFMAGSARNCMTGRFPAGGFAWDVPISDVTTVHGGVSR